MSHCQPIHDAAASRRRGTAIRCVGLVGGGYPNWLGVRYCAAKNNWQWTLRESECRWWTCCGRVTGGQGGRFGEKVWHVPKLELLARLQTLLETKRLRIADRMREAGTLGRELLNIKSARRASGRLKVGAEGAGEHDDLALRWRWRCGPEGRRRRGNSRGGCREYRLAGRLWGKANPTSSAIRVALSVAAGKAESPERQPGNDRRHRNREHPGADDVGGYTPANCFEAIDAAYASDSSGDGVSSRDRQSEMRRQENRAGGSSFGTESAAGL